MLTNQRDQCRSTGLRLPCHAENEDPAAANGENDSVHMRPAAIEQMAHFETEPHVFRCQRTTFRHFGE